MEIIEPTVNVNPELNGKENKSLLNIFSSYSEDLGGGFEGDMLLPPKTSTRGVAINGAIRRWPNGIIPYDISAITSKFFKKDFVFFCCLFPIE